MDTASIQGIGQTEALSGHARRPIGISQKPLSTSQPFFAYPLGHDAMNQLRKVELKFMVIARSIRTFHFAELALKTRLHDRPGLLVGQPLHTPVVFVVDQIEEHREGVAVLEAHTTAMADLKNAGNLSL